MTDAESPVKAQVPKPSPKAWKPPSRRTSSVQRSPLPDAPPGGTRSRGNSRQRGRSRSNTNPDGLSSKTRAIIKQVEYYFSKNNLMKDPSLKTQIEDDPDRYVPLSIIGGFNRVKALAKDIATIAEALSHSKILQVNAEKTKVRLAANPPPTPAKTPQPTPVSAHQDIKRTVYVGNLAPGSSVNSIRRLFSSFGVISHVTILPPESALTPIPCVAAAPLLPTPVEYLSLSPLGAPAETPAQSRNSRTPSIHEVQRMQRASIRQTKGSPLLQAVLDPTSRRPPSPGAASSHGKPRASHVLVPASPASPVMPPTMLLPVSAYVEFETKASARKAVYVILSHQKDKGLADVDPYTRRRSHTIAEDEDLIDCPLPMADDANSTPAPATDAAAASSSLAGPPAGLPTGKRPPRSPRGTGSVNNGTDRAAARAQSTLSFSNDNKGSAEDRLRAASDISTSSGTHKILSPARSRGQTTDSNTARDRNDSDETNASRRTSVTEGRQRRRSTMELDNRYDDVEVKFKAAYLALKEGNPTTSWTTRSSSPSFSIMSAEQRNSFSHTAGQHANTNTPTITKKVARRSLTNWRQAADPTEEPEVDLHAALEEHLPSPDDNSSGPDASTDSEPGEDGGKSRAGRSRRSTRSRTTSLSKQPVSGMFEGSVLSQINAGHAHPTTIAEESNSRRNSRRESHHTRSSSKSSSKQTQARRSSKSSLTEKRQSTPNRRAPSAGSNTSPGERRRYTFTSNRRNTQTLANTRYAKGPENNKAKGFAGRGRALAGSPNAGLAGAGRGKPVQLSAAAPVFVPTGSP